MPEPTNAARELAATGTPGPWARFEADALKITRAVNALGPLGDLLDAVDHLLVFGGALEAWDGWPLLEDARDAVEAALRGEQP